MIEKILLSNNVFDNFMKIWEKEWDQKIYAERLKQKTLSAIDAQFDLCKFLKVLVFVFYSNNLMVTRQFYENTFEVGI